MATITINENDVIVFDSYPDRYQVRGWTYGPEQPHARTITLEVNYLGTSGAGSELNMDDTLIMNSYPDQWRVDGWNYDPANPEVELVILDVTWLQ